MNFLRWIATWRNPVFDAVFGALTYAGGEVVFIVAALVVLWCVDKKRGYYLLFCGFFGLVTVQILKMAFRIPRPWVLDPAFQIVENARAGATGYSFPSGHSVTSIVFYGLMLYLIQKHCKNEKLKAVLSWICGILAVVIGPSRIYVGVHWPTDVLAGWCLGGGILIIAILILEKIYVKKELQP